MIMRKTILIILVFSSFILKGQNDNDVLNNIGSDFYNQGVDAFQNGKFREADSLYTKSIIYFYSNDAFFNRALTRLMLKDTCKACYDFKIAGEVFYDKEALNIYSNFCLLKSDTTYYNKKNQKLNNSIDYKYYEELKTSRCDSIIYGTVHEKNHNSTVMYSIYNLSNEKNVDIIATYLLIDSVKYYDFIYAYSFYDNNKVIIESFKSDFKKYLKAIYHFDSIANKDRYFNLNILVNNEGKVVKSIIEYNPFQQFDKTIRNKIKADIYYYALLMPKLKPAKLLGKYVSQTYVITIGL
jgi:hypothetical protein